MAVIQQHREVGEFDMVQMNGTGNISLQQGEADTLIIETEESLLANLKSEVKDGKLNLGFEHWYDYLTQIGHPKIHYIITMRKVRGVTISGSGKLEAGRIETDRLALKVSGAGDMKLEELRAADLETHISGSGSTLINAGSVKSQEVHISGSGTLRTAELDCEEAQVRISGSGDVRLRASTRLSVTISGSGDVRFAGDPTVEHKISGSGSVRKL